MYLKKIFGGFFLLLICFMVYELVYFMDAVQNQSFKPEDLSILKEISLKLSSAPTQFQNRPLFVLILSSNPRSGSTMFSELLATRNNSVLFFEPLWNQMNKPCFQKGSCVSDFIYSIFNCTYEQEFEDWFRDKTIFFQYYHPFAPRCLRETCRQKFDIRGLCQISKTRIVKVIRARLSWMRELLENPQINVKIIFLMRDPRGSISSIMKGGYDATPKIKCGNLYKDMKAYERLKNIYPNRIKSVQLEILSLEQVKVIEDIHSFMYDNPEIPKETEKYIQTHMNVDVTKIDSMDTRKNSSTEYQAWRLNISPSLLHKIEKEPVCIKVLLKMGHTIFKTIEMVRNMSVSLWKEDPENLSKTSIN